MKRMDAQITRRLHVVAQNLCTKSHAHAELYMGKQKYSKTKIKLWELSQWMALGAR